MADDTVPPNRRATVVVLSDLHLGIGKTADGRWDAREDFRWTSALRGFLAHIGKQESDRVDLVIAGDFLELWQPQDSVQCKGSVAAACSSDEMEAIVRNVVHQHAADLQALSEFAKRGSNRLIIIPGNHDAALLLPNVRKHLFLPLDLRDERLVFVEQGIWSSFDGRLVIEHGHQIGADVNAFAHWPDIAVPASGKHYVESPWGERFVQGLFNDEEKTYPIIDNLSPESAGARLRIADRGLWKSAEDLARFLAFNLFETSVAQKVQALGADGKPVHAECSRSLGYRLFTSALPVDDPFRSEAEGGSVQAKALQAQLDMLAANLPEDEFEQVCDQRRGATSLGGAVESTFVPRLSVIKTHLRKRMKDFRNMTVFVYAHTHRIETPHDVKLDLDRSVSVANTGAFQRLIDEPGYMARVKTMNLATPGEGLSKVPIESLAPCYSFVIVRQADGTLGPVADTRLWRMEEAEAQGRIVPPRDSTCQ